MSKQFEIVRSSDNEEGKSVLYANRPETHNGQLNTNDNRKP